MTMMKATGGLLFAAILTTAWSAVPTGAYAGALDQLQDAAEHGQAAVEATSDEEAKDESNQPFDYDTHDAGGEESSSDDAEGE